MLSVWALATALSRLSFQVRNRDTSGNFSIFMSEGLDPTSDVRFCRTSPEILPAELLAGAPPALSAARGAGVGAATGGAGPTAAEVAVSGG